METLNYVLSLVEAFRAFDSDNDGSITAQELGGIMGSLGYNMSDQDLEAMMHKGSHPNRNELLSISEFLEMNTRGLELGCLTALKTCFDMLNFDEDDLVTGEELYEVVGDMEIGLSYDDCQHIVGCMDGDGDHGDGAVTFKDFKLIINSIV
ncbi:hypothetical protein BUALT_Bualt01G0007900 [Buddleja alternifolia]|uniref:EF-hand domain-containing protein n=1 Tax=Buddleja alternifolia TaxID=168488 RepID=A0AAV6Y4U0_9LAMI|nr:hypothetical protein BUALT_Bualt01G0007900 [Buddleja alternifolia]